eukprot:829296_1
MAYDHRSIPAINVFNFNNVNKSTVASAVKSTTHSVATPACRTPFANDSTNFTNNLIVKPEEMSRKITTPATVTIGSKIFPVVKFPTLPNSDFPDLYKNEKSNTYPFHFLCKLCDKTFATVDEKRVHVRIEHHYDCRFCGMQFPTNGQRNQHEILHTGERKFECSLCHKRFRRKQQVKKHVKSFHLVLRLHRCPLCSDTFVNKGSVETHVALKHSDEKKFECETCGKRSEE